VVAGGLLVVRGLLVVAGGLLVVRGLLVVVESLLISDRGYVPFCSGC